MVTVKAHTAKYEAADKAKELSKKEGAGDEFEERKKKKTSQLESPLDKETEKGILDEVKEATKKEKPSKELKVKATKEAKSSTKTKAESKSKKAETQRNLLNLQQLKHLLISPESIKQKK